MSVFHESFRIDVLRNGVKVTELKTDTSPVIRMQSESAIKTCFSGEFINNEEVDWLRDEIQPVFIRDGIEYPYGIFLPVSVRKSESNGINRVNVEAYDRCWRIQSTHTENTMHLSAGQKYTDVVKSLLAMSGIALAIITESAETLRVDREDWTIGTDLLTIANALLDEINYSNVWFNSEGIAVVEPKKQIVAQNISRRYTYDDINSLMLDSASTTIDLYNAPNVFIVVCQNPDTGEPMVSKAENNNPISPLSIIRRGRRISQLYSIDNIASQQALDEYALMIRQQNMLMSESVGISTAIIPNCGVNEIVAVVHPSFEGLCVETGWSITLNTGGTMTHELKRVMLDVG